ncbi:MAG TPA: hypothetical protein VKE27_08095, partial [Candidatus Dormibacteraeota bacterium]|nr:hypothetical protein [Candidatus Dormibacteraeota bacterium]
ATVVSATRFTAAELPEVTTSLHVAGLLKLPPPVHVHGVSPSGVVAVPGVAFVADAGAAGHAAPNPDWAHCSEPAGTVRFSPWTVHVADELLPAAQSPPPRAGGAEVKPTVPKYAAMTNVPAARWTSGCERRRAAT